MGRKTLQNSQILHPAERFSDVTGQCHRSVLGCARKQHRSAAELADHESLQQGRPVGLQRAGGRGGHEEHPRRRGPEAVELQHHGALANNATLATVAANYGLKTVVDQHSLDIAARITPLEVDTKVANAFLGVVSAAAVASELASRDASISRGCRPPALTAYALLSAVNTSSGVDSKIAAALLDAVTTAALDAALVGKADASALADLLHGGRAGHAAGGGHQDSKCPAGSRRRGLRRSAAC